MFCDFFFVPKDRNKKGLTLHQMVLTEGSLARSAVPPPWPSACVFQSPYVSETEHLWRRGRIAYCPRPWQWYERAGTGT